MKSKTNGFATKQDLNKLEIGMGKRFGQIDERFEQIDEQLIAMRKEFSLIRIFIKEDLGWFKHDLLQEFRHEWNIKIDPILVEIEKHHEQEMLWAEQNHRRDEKIDRIEKLLYHVAQKIGVGTEHIS